MSGGVLGGLLSDDLLAKAYAFSTAPALRAYFIRSPEVQQVGEALRRGVIMEDSVSGFVKDLLGNMKQGILFRHDLTLGALATALESRYTPFVEGFLKELAELRVAEMPLAPRVAAEVLNRRPSSISNQALREQVCPTGQRIVKDYRELGDFLHSNSDDQTKEVMLGRA